jgi:hypothetical protein
MGAEEKHLDDRKPMSRSQDLFGGDDTPMAETALDQRGPTESKYELFGKNGIIAGGDPASMAPLGAQRSCTAWDGGDVVGISLIAARTYAPPVAAQ